MNRPCAAIAVFAASISAVSSLVLLSDLPTPSFVIDTQALIRRCYVGPPRDEAATQLPPSIRCPGNDIVLCPVVTDGKGNSVQHENQLILDCAFEVIEGEPAMGYLHSSVLRAREDAIPGQDDPLSTFLAEIDLDPSLCSGDATLVLGLNNHHVGGYYWARSAGAGASMEAPGVEFSISADQTVLRWQSDNGPTACNSNDGKRSEWVNFLRKRDTVQLVPGDGQGTLLRFRDHFGAQSADEESEVGTPIQVFGITSEGRPMGSEPEVVCEYRTSGA